MTLESMGSIHGHAARVIAVFSEESRRVSNAKIQSPISLVQGVFEKDFSDSQCLNMPRKRGQLYLVG